jgi:hypothetical protein
MVDEVVEIHVVTPERLVRIALLDDGETILALDAFVLATSPRTLLPALPRLPLTRVLLAFGCVMIPLVLEAVSTRSCRQKRRICRTAFNFINF